MYPTALTSQHLGDPKLKGHNKQHWHAHMVIITMQTAVVTMVMMVIMMMMMMMTAAL
jgi:hypothetical protein